MQCSRHQCIVNIKDKHNVLCLPSVCLSVAAVNQAVKENKVNQTLRVLTLPDVQLQGVLPACAADYQRELYSLITDRKYKGTAHRQQTVTEHRVHLSEFLFIYTFSLCHLT